MKKKYDISYNSLGLVYMIRKRPKKWLGDEVIKLEDNEYKDYRDMLKRFMKWQTRLRNICEKGEIK